MEVVSAPSSPFISKHRPVRVAYKALGFAFVGLGLLGAILPVMPSTVFMLLALWSFSKSSPRLESWLLNHPRFGRTLRDWRERRSIKMSTKILAVSLIWVSILASIAFTSKPVVQILLLVTAVALTIFLLTRKTAQNG